MVPSRKLDSDEEEVEGEGKEERLVPATVVDLDNFELLVVRFDSTSSEIEELLDSFTELSGFWVWGGLGDFVGTG